MSPVGVDGMQVSFKLITRWTPTFLRTVIITPLIGSQLPIYKAIYRGPITPFIASRGPSCMNYATEIPRCARLVEGGSLRWLNRPSMQSSPLGQLLL